MSDADWPALPLEGWRDTYDTLHFWSQIVGKVALARAHPLNHSWGVALHLTPRGLTTLPLYQGEDTYTIDFDFLDHRLYVRTTLGETRWLTLEPRSVAEFYRALLGLLEEMKLPAQIWPVAVEVPTPFRLDQDEEHRSYDREAVGRWWRILSASARELGAARCGFVGKASPVHFFWGGFDLAVTRFNGKTAPPREGPAFMREAYSHEVISHGFWPGSAPVLEPAYYAYAAPVPESLKHARVQPDAAYYHLELNEFILPYEAVRTAPSPERAIREFVDSTYAAAAAAAGWDVEGLAWRAPA